MDQVELEALYEQNGGDLSDDQMAVLLSGGDLELGDKVADLPNSDQDDKAIDAEAKVEVDPEAKPVETDLDSKDNDDKAGEVEKVILAKDGVHTIEYEKLVEARDSAKNNKAEADSWKEIADAKDVLIKELQDKAADDGTAQSEVDADDAVKLLADLDELAEDYPEAAKGIKALLESNKTLAEKVESLGDLVKTTTESVEENSVKSAAEKHFDTIRDAHSDFAEVVESNEFKAWVEEQPKFLQKTYLDVLKEGTASDVIEMLDNFKPVVAANDKADGVKEALVDKAIDKKIADAEKSTTTPSSLSDIPAGTQNVHDDGEKLRSASSLDLIDSFAGKSQEQIEALLDKAL